MSVPKSVGRSARPKADTESKTVILHFSEEDRKRIEAAAKARNQSLSDWIRDAIEIKICGPSAAAQDGANRVH